MQLTQISILMETSIVFNYRSNLKVARLQRKLILSNRGFFVYNKFYSSAKGSLAPEFWRKFVPQAYSFYPSPKRRFIRLMVYVVIVALGQTLVNSFGYGYFLVMGGLGLILASVFAYDNSLPIKIAHGRITGPSLPSFFDIKHVEFGLTAVDKRRTRQQSLWNKLNGRTIIYAKDGQKIQIDHTSFDKTKRAEIPNALKLNEYP